MGMGRTLLLPEEVKSSSAVAQEAPPCLPKHLHPDQDTSSGSLSVSQAACFPLGSAQLSCGLLQFSSPISTLLAHRPVCSLCSSLSRKDPWRSRPVTVALP